MANVRSSDLVFVGGWCSGPLAGEFKRVLSKKKLSVSEALERCAESVVREYYAEQGKRMPSKIEQALAERKQRKASMPWLAKPKKPRRPKRLSPSRN